jgi:hypothetical protein
MSISRRQFLLSTVGAAGGFILPSFYVRALEFLDQYDEPLLVPPTKVVDELIVCWDRDGELNLGDPWSEPPDMTWRQCIERYYPDTLEDVELHWDLRQSELDSPAPWDWVVDLWIRTDSPNALAYRLLENLDLGPELTGPVAVGGLIFTDGACPGNDYLGVAVQDDISISLLQQRLNDLDTGIKVCVS